MVTATAVAPRQKIDMGTTRTGMAAGRVTDMKMGGTRDTETNMKTGGTGDTETDMTAGGTRDTETDMKTGGTRDRETDMKTGGTIDRETGMAPGATRGGEVVTSPTRLAAATHTHAGRGTTAETTTATTKATAKNAHAGGSRPGDPIGLPRARHRCHSATGVSDALGAQVQAYGASGRGRSTPP